MDPDREKNHFAGFLFAGIFLCAFPAFGAHPLITDDTGVQGKGSYQMEVTGERSRDSGDGITENRILAAATLIYRAADRIDIGFSAPWIRSKTDTDGNTTSERGTADVSLFAKWQFWETEGLSLAVKPGLTLATGDESRGLGTGKTGYSLYLIATKEMKVFAVHANLGYLRNENRLDERNNLRNASVAADYTVAPAFRIVANVGQETNRDKADNTDPAYLLGGFIYSPGENLDLDLGYKTKLTRSEADQTVLAGITARW